MLEGMRSTTFHLHVAKLQRDLTLDDLRAISVWPAALGIVHHLGAARGKKWGCSQVAVQNGDGTVMAGRNLDGPNDDYDVCHSQLLLMAMEKPGQHRYVSVAWPSWDTQRFQ